MKKLYFLNEEEKERILKLHKSKQIGKFWLNEQGSTIDTDKTTGNPTALPMGSWTIESKQEFDEIINNYNVNETAGYYVRPVVKRLKGFCASAILGPPTLDSRVLKANVESQESVMKANSMSTGGVFTRGVTDKGTGFVPFIKQLQNIPNFCYAVQNFRQLRQAGETILDLYDEIYRNTNFQKNILETLKALSEQTKVAKLGSSTGGGTGTGAIDDVEWEKTQLEFYKTYPCLKDVAVASKAKNAIVVQNPSEHEQIIDQSQRKRTDITDKTTFMLDGTYITYTDAKANAVSGKFQCSRDGELTLLYPGKVGMGSEGGIYSKFPCLGQPRKDGTPYTEIDSGNNNQANMDNEERKTHPIFSGYPEGDIYFSSDGTFLTENDFNNDLEKSGRFKCKSKGRIFAAPFKGVSTEPIKTTPIVTTGGGGGSKTIGGMGVVSASAADVTEILKCANIGGSTLDQVALNKLYEYIKNNKK